MASQRADETKVTNELPFTTTADTTISRRERVAHHIDSYVLAPFRILWSDWRARVGLVIIVFYILMGTVGVLMNPVPYTGMGPRYLQPFHEGWFTLEPVSFSGSPSPLIHDSISFSEPARWDRASGRNSSMRRQRC